MKPKVRQLLRLGRSERFDGRSEDAWQRLQVCLLKLSATRVENKGENKNAYVYKIRVVCHIKIMLLVGRWI